MLQIEAVQAAHRADVAAAERPGPRGGRAGGGADGLLLVSHPGPRGGVGGSGSGASLRPAVWVVTGTGHHTGQTHVKAGSLYVAVEAYLAELGYDFARARDGAGRSGAFAVFG